MNQSNPPIGITGAPATAAPGTAATHTPGGSGSTRPLDEAKQSVKTGVQQAGETIREQRDAAVDQLKQSADSAVRQAQEAGRNFFDQQRESLAHKVDEYAEAVRVAAERLDEEEGNVLAAPAGRAAEQLGKVSGYLREKEPGDLLADLETFARRRPEMVFGGLFIAGLAASRFLKASRPEPRGRRAAPDPFPPAGAGLYTAGTGDADYGSQVDDPITTAPGATSTGNY